MIGSDRYSPAYYLEEQPKPDTITAGGRSAGLARSNSLPGSNLLPLQPEDFPSQWEIAPRRQFACVHLLFSRFQLLLEELDLLPNQIFFLRGIRIERSQISFDIQKFLLDAKNF